MGSIRIGCVRIEPQAEALRVTYEYDPRIGGMPRRYSYRGEPTNSSFDLCLNQWGRVKYNGRFSDDAGWWYLKVVFNIGWFDGVSQDVFVSTRPEHTIDQMATLR
ncbi:MAG TPA: hypothetical protein VJ810_21285 [Blastocatellia bacterium]|nr:hypothetical protein [Blastocatellia bacterium]